MKKNLILIICILFVNGYANAGDLQVESEVQHYSEKANKIELQGDVKVKYDDINVVSPKAEVLMDASGKKIESVRFLDNAYSYQVSANKKHEVKAKILEVSLLNKVFQAKDRTQTTVLKDNQPTIIVTADNQEYDNNTNTMVAKGAVSVLYKDVNAFADSAKVELNDNNDIKKLILQGHANIKKLNSNVTADKFVYYADKKVATASGKVFSDIKEENVSLKVWSDFQQIDQNSNIMTVSGHAKIHYKDFVAEGPKASVYTEPDTKRFNRVVFIGRSKITNSGRSVEADKINMTLNPKDFKAEGNVKTFIPNVGNSTTEAL